MLRSLFVVLCLGVTLAGQALPEFARSEPVPIVLPEPPDMPRSDFTLTEGLRGIETRAELQAFIEAVASNFSGSGAPSGDQLRANLVFTDSTDDVTKQVPDSGIASDSMALWPSDSAPMHLIAVELTPLTVTDEGGGVYSYDVNPYLEGLLVVNDFLTADTLTITLPSYDDAPNKSLVIIRGDNGSDFTLSIQPASGEGFLEYVDDGDLRLFSYYDFVRLSNAGKGAGLPFTDTKWFVESHRFREVHEFSSGPVTLKGYEKHVLADTTSAGFTITIPLYLNSLVEGLHFKNTGTGGNDLTLQTPAGAFDIDGASTKVLADGESVYLAYAHSGEMHSF